MCLLNNKVLITGGTGSVGQSLVEIFSLNGYDVSFQYCGNDDKATELMSKYRVKSIKMDFKKEFYFESTNYDIFINNAAINISEALTHEVNIGNWDDTMLINVTVPFKICQLVLPYMLKNRWGRIINISSIYGLTSVESYLPYTVSKHALTGLTRTIAKEYASHGITCNEICPGPIESDMMTRIATKEALGEGVTTEEYVNQICDAIPAKRLANPNDVSSLALFIASLQASYISGVSIPLDGGFLA
jgi:NAD(P)-dependent dehydrogenase (short-subunit alcohol dehydrogenase family)